MKKVDLSKYNNDWYIVGASGWRRLLWYFVNVIFFINPLNPVSSLKVWLLKLFGAKIGRNVIIKPRVNIKYPWKLAVGENVWIGEDVWIDNLEKVVVGDHSCISQGAMLLTGNHNYKKESFDLILGEIILEEGVWIGAKSIVCPNVTCASHSILSVNSVATKNLDSYTIYQGNPAVPVRKREME